MFPEAPEISFAQWFLFAFPVSVVFFIIIWTYLYLLFKPKDKNWENLNIDSFRNQYKKLGAITFEQRVVFIVFISLALLWLFRSDIVIGNFSLPGWSSLFAYPDYINDGTVAIFASIILFMIPSKSHKGKTLMDWETAKGIPWNIVLLFGGGFALASGFKESELSIWFGSQLSFVGKLPSDHHHRNYLLYDDLFN